MWMNAWPTLPSLVLSLWLGYLSLLAIWLKVSCLLFSMVLISWMAPPVCLSDQLPAPHRGRCRSPAQCCAQQIHPDLSPPWYLMCALDMRVSTAAYRCHAPSCLRASVFDIPPVEMPSLYPLAFLNLPISLMSDFVYFILLHNHSSIQCGNVCTGLGSDYLAFNGFWHCWALSWVT